MAALLAGCRTPVPAGDVLKMNVELVREGKLDRINIHAYRVAMMLIDEPVWEGEAPGYDRSRFLERKAYYRGEFRWSLIRDWLRSHYEHGSDLDVAKVYEFRTMAEMRAFLGCDPEEQGIPVVESVRQQYQDLEPVVWPAERVRFISGQMPSHFSASIWPLIVQRESQGQSWTGLELAEASGVVDRWAIGYLTSHGRLYGTLLLRVRGLWALWPLVR